MKKLFLIYDKEYPGEIYYKIDDIKLLFNLINHETEYKTLRLLFDRHFMKKEYLKSEFYDNFWTYRL